MRFKQAIDAASASIPEKTAEVIKAEFNLFPESTTLSDFNEKFLSKNKDSVRHIFAGLRVRQMLPSHDKSKSEPEILACLSPSVKLSEAIEGLELLSSWKSSAESYVAKANSLWPEAAIFKTEKNV